MELAKIIIYVIFSIVGFFSAITLIKFLALRSIETDAETRRNFQGDVFGWAYKIVCTIEEEYRDSDLEKKVKSKRKFDQAVSRFNDVLMINGTDPKFWNIPGILTYAIYIMHEKERTGKKYVI